VLLSGVVLLDVEAAGEVHVAHVAAHVHLPGEVRHLVPVLPPHLVLLQVPRRHAQHAAEDARHRRHILLCRASAGWWWAPTVAEVEEGSCSSAARGCRLAPAVERVVVRAPAVGRGDRLAPAVERVVCAPAVAAGSDVLVRGDRLARAVERVVVRAPAVGRCEGGDHLAPAAEPSPTAACAGTASAAAGGRRGTPEAVLPQASLPMCDALALLLVELEAAAGVEVEVGVPVEGHKIE
jgi:hypothetical protein